MNRCSQVGGLDRKGKGGPNVIMSNLKNVACLNVTCLCHKVLHISLVFFKTWVSCMSL